MFKKFFNYLFSFVLDPLAPGVQAPTPEVVEPPKPVIKIHPSKIPAKVKWKGGKRRKNK